MGLYSVFLGLGQVIGAVVGGVAASIMGIDGLIVATALLLVVGIAALLHLRSVESELLAGSRDGQGPAERPAVPFREPRAAHAAVPAEARDKEFR